MKYVATICIALLVSVLVCQLLILSRLNEISKSAGVVSALSAPSVVAVASEETPKQTGSRKERQSAPATFQIKPTGYEAANTRLQGATLTIVRDGGGPVADLAVTPPVGIRSLLQKLQRIDNYDDRFSVSFKPEIGKYLPEPLIFSLEYTDADGNRQERSFTVTYDGEKMPGPGGGLDVREKCWPNKLDKAK